MHLGDCRQLNAHVVKYVNWGFLSGAKEKHSQYHMEIMSLNATAIHSPECRGQNWPCSLGVRDGWYTRSPVKHSDTNQSWASVSSWTVYGRRWLMLSCPIMVHCIKKMQWQSCICLGVSLCWFLLSLVGSCHAIGEN